MFSGRRTTQGTFTLLSGPAHPLRVRGRKTAGLGRMPHGVASEWQKRLQEVDRAHHARYPAMGARERGLAAKWHLHALCWQPDYAGPGKVGNERHRDFSKPCELIFNRGPKCLRLLKRYIPR